MHRLLVFATAALAAVALSVPVSLAATTATKPTTISISVKKGRPVGGIKRPTVKKGQVVRLVITTDAGSEIHVHGYDIERVPRKGKPTVIQFTAKLPGRFEVELHHPDVLLANLTVKP